jgi:predicted O-methyltransferase YrrM
LPKKLLSLPVWERLLEPLKGKPGLHYLEVGVHEGRSALWMLENVLTHPTSHLTGVDIFADEYQGRSGGYKETYLGNLELSEVAERTTTIEGSSQTVLRTLPLSSFDLIYVDGSHQNADVLEDSVLCWRLLKDGGLLIFDDYGAEAGHPRLGIEAFTRFFGEYFAVLHNSYQLILKKKYLSESAAADPD